MSFGKNRQPLGSNAHKARQTAGGHTGSKHQNQRAESPAVAQLREKMGALCNNSN